MDLSGNKLEYISPKFLGHIVTLEDIRLDDNELHIMETYAEFEKLFVTFLILLYAEYRYLAMGSPTYQTIYSVRTYI